MPTKSVRLAVELVEETRRLGGDRSFSEVVTEALEEWLRAKRREREDDLIEEALGRRPPGQRADERKLAKTAGRAGRRAMEKLDG